MLTELLSGMRCEKKHMFGAPVFFAEKAMFAGVFGDDIFIRLDEAERTRFLKENKDSKIFEPVIGRAMKEYVIAPHSLLKNKPAMRGWLTFSMEYASRLKKK